MLTLLSTVKARLRLDDSDVRDDVLLTNFIAWVSARFEADCNRSFSYGSYDEEFGGDETELRVRAFPINTLVSLSIALKSTEAEGFIDQTSSIDYVIRKSCIVALRMRLGLAEDIIRLSYAGGYVLPPNKAQIGQTDLPDDLQFAAVEQIAYLYQNKDRLGIVSLSGEGGSIAQFAKLDLLPAVQSTLNKYERWMP